MRILAPQFRKTITANFDRNAGWARLRLFRRISIGFCLLLMSCVFVEDIGLDAQASVQASDHTDRTAQGWFLAGSKSENYRTGVDPFDYQGQPVSFLRNALPETTGYGTLMQTVAATPYLGKRIRLRALIKSQNVGDWAGLWMRVDKNDTTVAFDNMYSRAIRGTQAWGGYDVVLDVPTDATSISFGVLLWGPGQVEMNQVTLEPVGAETEVTGARINQPSKTRVSPDSTH